jgi:hypothetical protein
MAAQTRMRIKPIMSLDREPSATAPMEPIATRGGRRSPACEFRGLARQPWHRLKAPRPFWRGGRLSLCEAGTSTQPHPNFWQKAKAQPACGQSKTRAPAWDELPLRVVSGQSAFGMRQLETGLSPRGQDWSKHADTILRISVLDPSGRNQRYPRDWQPGPPGTPRMNCSFEDARWNAPTLRGGRGIFPVRTRGIFPVRTSGSLSTPSVSSPCNGCPT